MPQPRPAGGDRDGHPGGRRDGQATGPTGDPGDAPADRGSDAAPGAPGSRDATAANLRTGLGARLRTAYEQGATLTDLAAACRRTAAETRTLLLAAGADLSGQARPAAAGATPARPDRRPVQRSGQRSEQQPVQRSEQWSGRPEAAPAERTDRPEAAGRSARGARSANRRAQPALPAAASPKVEPAPAKRPSPARRLSRLHPRPAGDPAPAPPAAERGGLPAGGPEPLSETPLGILIGGTPNLPEPENRPQERRYVLAEARMIRPGRGTCLVVFPSWRPAIAVSVPTEQLLAATGLGYGQLPCAVLSVFINPEALHDRELGLHGWRVRAPRRGGARSRRD
ncbi:hypothetical protein OG689_26610 [Kitasatospora sp. NBC_00240]|uniref:hypothetical protein n=1 Tax=Kitasatospora sp. NBC_00240 TaxID=2903567 RepID=UPI00225200A0|nr:hypothetical protein [Kitasatospora sp. NBC_00240]MCX5212808.1 hypothetical protein [Kitasatospora sp. NBC_00240]